LACRPLRASGCEIVGIELDEALVARVRASRIDARVRSELDLEALPFCASDCDAVLITATTGSDDPVKLASPLARDRARDRRFAPLAQTMLNDAGEGGGRLLAEGCHFVDFACWLLGGLLTQVSAVAGTAAEQLVSAQRFLISLGFPGGSVATIMYGSESAPNALRALEAAGGHRTEETLA